MRWYISKIISSYIYRSAKTNTTHKSKYDSWCIFAIITIIYELLLAIQDQIIKVSSFAAATEGDIESANSKIVEFLKEIDNIAESANYNGRRLLASHSDNDGADLVNDFTGTNGNSDETYDGVIPDDDPDASNITFRFMGCNGFCRQVTSENSSPTENDWIYELPKAGTGYLFDNNATTITVGLDTNGTTGNAGQGGDWVDISVVLVDAAFNHDTAPAVVITDAADGDDIDTQVTRVNCAIKEIGVELDKLRAYRYVLCMREKQIKICKNGQEICYEHKCKL